MTSWRGRRARRGNLAGPLTVLFVDIVNAPARPPRSARKPTRKHFRDAVVREISLHGGRISRCGGNAIVAFWHGAEAIHTVTACRIALTCQRIAYRPKGASAAMRTSRLRIGIDSSGAVADEVGSGIPRDGITADPREVVRNLVCASDHYGCEVVVGASAYRLARDYIEARELDWLLWPGPRGKRPVYELLGMHGTQSTRWTWPSLYEAGLAAYRARDFSGAMRLFLMLLMVRHRDRPARAMIQKCLRLLAAPPGEDWDAATSIEMATADHRRGLSKRY